jgi:hypothetical protein
MAQIRQKKPKIRAIGVTCSSLNKSHYQPLFKEEKRREALLKAVDAINSKHGEASIYPAITELTRKMQYSNILMKSVARCKG